MSNSSPASKLLSLLYLCGIILICDQVADLLATLLVGDPAPSTAVWRFGTFGLLATRMSVFLLADLMLLVPAVVLEHRRMLLFLGWSHLVIAVLLFAGVIMFGLDWLQVRGSRVQPAARTTLDLAAIRAAGMMGLLGIGALWAGIVAIKLYRVHKSKPVRRDGDPAPLFPHQRPGSIS